MGLDSAKTNKNYADMSVIKIFTELESYKNLPI
jgi:hypothetical protein